MNPFGIALKMLRANSKSYRLYFIILTAASALYYNFAALKYNPQIAAVSDIGYVALAIYLCTIVFAFFIYYFMLTSNAFLLKRRTKEIALYFLMGVDNGKIGKVFAIETMCLMLGSAAAGLGIGIIMSKLFIMGFAKVASIDIVIDFLIPLAAVKELMAVILFLSVMLIFYNHRRISRMKIIDLLNNAKKMEVPPKNMVIRGVMAVALIAGGYVYAQGMLTNAGMLFIGIIVAVLILVGTNLLFDGLLPLVLQQIMNTKEFLYNSGNIVTFGSLSFRIRSAAKTWAMTAICVAASVTTLSASITIWYYITVQNSDSLQNFAQVSQRSALYISALFSYIGPIMAVIFLCALGATLYFRALSEAMEDCGRYEVLSKIGMTDGQMKNAIRKQVAISMIVPATLGICHAAVATLLLEDALDVSVTFPFLAAVSIFCLLYGSFYWAISENLSNFVRVQS